MNRNERNHARALASSLQVNGLLAPNEIDDLSDGFTTFEEAYEGLLAVAEQHDFAQSIWNKPIDTRAIAADEGASG